MADENDDDLGLGRNKMPKVAKVKNKMPAPVQITAEQLLREAKERELELVQPPPKQKISDEEELKDYQMRKRKKFEDNLRKNRSLITTWLAYASWEESQHNLRNARSVYERALDVDHRNRVIWLRYAEMEMKNRQINSARNVWDRAVSILPRADQLWFKYVYMEEKLGNVAGCRQVFERWMEWQPGEQAWMSYINFEIRCKELNRARVIYERFVCIHPTTKNWIKYAKFEEKNGFIDSARSIFERAGIYFGLEHIDEALFIAFARFEEGQKEHERARAIYKKALELLPRDKCQEIQRLHTVHEKRFGDHAAIDNVIMSKRKFKYEEAVEANKYDYDSWYQYIRVMESEGLENAEQIIELYERAIANKPPSQEKQHWRRYIYLWINYALFAELDLGDMSVTREIYKQCLENIPHKRFTFAKIWIMFAEFEIRQKDVAAARKIMGHAIGRCPKDKLFREYIALEQQLVQFDRCRRLYEKFLEFSPENCRTWIDFALMEEYVDDIPRARAVFELAINQPVLDMPEVLWKAYIDFELKQENYQEALVLHRRLLERTQHVQVWLSYAKTQMSMDSEDSTKKAREVFMDANRKLKTCDNKEDRKQLLEAWKNFESEFGNEKTKADVERLQPTTVTRRRKCETESGAELWEEYVDYVFPDDEAAKPNLKLLSMAKSWKFSKAAENTSVNTASSEDAGNKEDHLVQEKGRNVEVGGETPESESESSASDSEVQKQQPKASKSESESSSETSASDSSDDEDGHSKRNNLKAPNSNSLSQPQNSEFNNSNTVQKPRQHSSKEEEEDSGSSSDGEHERPSKTSRRRSDDEREQKNSRKTQSDSEEEPKRKRIKKGQSESNSDDDEEQKPNQKGQSRQSDSDDETRRKLIQKGQSRQSKSDSSSEEEARRKRSPKRQSHQAKSESSSVEEARRKQSQKRQPHKSESDSSSEEEVRRKKNQERQSRQSESESSSEEEAKRKQSQKGQSRQSDLKDEARQKQSQKRQSRQSKSESSSEEEAKQKQSQKRRSRHTNSDSDDASRWKKKSFRRPGSDEDDEHRKFKRRGRSDAH